jgi:hypothetical protein
MFGPLLSPAELSELLGLPTATLANWRSAEVDEWLASQPRRPRSRERV